MTDNLRDRIAAVLTAHPDKSDGTCCGRQDFATQDEWAAHVADAVIRELTHAIPPIVATAIQGYAQSELAAMSYHGGSKDAFDLMEKMNREALQIALYATTHKDWNG